MRVLVIGSGGREHALCWKIAQSPLLTKLYATPGNPGIASLAECQPVDSSDPSAVLGLAQRLHIDMVVVGPEDPLALGVSDALARARIAVFGPSQQAARVESSKHFAKQVMEAVGVPYPISADFSDFTSAERYVLALPEGRIVVKADGLFHGKGVIVTSSRQEALTVLERMLVHRQFGAAGQKAIVEQFLEGDERSYIALCDGERTVLFPPARDHKRAFDGDRGPNTGGMGVIAPAIRAEDPPLDAVESQIFRPVLQELARRGSPFRGALFAGVMLTNEGPKVLEFNARFGDPEAEALLPLLDEDLLPLLYAAATGSLPARPLRMRAGACVSVVLASDGYPDHYDAGIPIEHVEEAVQISDAFVFHAGTALRDHQLVTAGGRVLCVTGTGFDLAAAYRVAYTAAEKISWHGKQFRRDIGASWW
ncbi:MAG: phosphoribosylamine--glycine ligase [Chloroflexi bacterium]|nr:phosphoribosylamine--glycine ligase [Chloroflexota bacterium]